MDSGFSFFYPTNQTYGFNFLFSYIIRDSEPVWFYCRQTTPESHTHRGIIFGLNAGDRMDEFKKNAEVDGRQLAGYRDTEQSPRARRRFEQHLPQAAYYWRSFLPSGMILLDDKICHGTIKACKQRLH